MMMRPRVDFLRCRCTRLDITRNSAARFNCRCAVLEAQDAPHDLSLSCVQLSTIISTTRSKAAHKPTAPHDLLARIHPIADAHKQSRRVEGKLASTAALKSAAGFVAPSLWSHINQGRPAIMQRQHHRPSADGVSSTMPSCVSFSRPSAGYRKPTLPNGATT